MLENLNAMREIRSEVQNFREEVLFQHKSFMEELALKKTEQNTESLITVIFVNNLYKEGFSLFNEAKSIVCTNESDFVKKAELLDNSQQIIGIANEMVEFLIKEEMPTRFFKNNREGLLDIKGLLKLMNQGKFNAVDSIIKDFIPDINVDKEILDNAFELFEGISLREVKSEEDLIDLISRFTEKQKEMISYLPAEKPEEIISYLPAQSDEDLYGLAEKESEEDSDGFILDEPNEDLDLDVEFNDDLFGLAEKQSDEELYGLAEKESEEGSDGFILDEPNEDLDLDLDVEFNDDFFGLTEKQSDEELYGLAEKESEEGSDGFILDEPNEDLDLDLDVEFNDDFFGLTEKQSDEELYGLAEKQSNEDSDGFILDEPNEDCLDKKHEELERKMKDIWSTRFSVAEKDQLNHTYSKNSALAL